MSKKRHQQRRHRKKSAWIAVWTVITTCGLSTYRIYQMAKAIWEAIRFIFGLD
ncbi:hypothetical protein [Limimaricola sp. AA108-03]|uniref:hypothetical protein n=1 Tax=Limimaricola sp. AA108-03 TaxID=3425945 RepID=UPI003D77995F